MKVARDYADLSCMAADCVADLLRRTPVARIVVPTGTTPLGMYRDLAQRRRRAELDVSRLHVFQLDEYLGLPPDEPRSLYRWMREVFLAPLQIDDSRVTSLPGDAPDPAAACAAYDRAVQAAGGLDLAVLGLGPNGHLGFNEPPSNPDAPTRVVTLSPESIVSNARYWGGEDRVPRRALTAGLCQLLSARHVLLLVSGRAKRDILERTMHGPVSREVPASFLRHAASVTIIADRDAMPSPHTV